ncbi:MAG: hypothetical protein WA061_04060 [Microgenomates group bacterium]
MKKLGIILLGVGFGVLCYIILTFLSSKQELVSPVEQPDKNVILQQNFKSN